MRYLVLIFLLSGCAILRTDPCELYEVSSSLKTTNDQPICFETIDSYDLSHSGKSNINIYGKLFFPKTQQGNITRLSFLMVRVVLGDIIGNM